MSEARSESEPAYHLFVDPDEVPVAASALRLFISDEAHQTEIRGLARGILDRLQAHPGGEAVLRMPLSPEEMKVVYSAVRLLLNDLQRGQNAERETLRRILEKLPDEHTMRAIRLP